MTSEEMETFTRGWWERKTLQPQPKIVFPKEKKISYPLASHFFFSRTTHQVTEAVGTHVSSGIFPENGTKQNKTQKQARYPVMDEKHTRRVIDEQCGSAPGRRECQDALQR